MLVHGDGSDAGLPRRSVLTCPVIGSTFEIGAIAVVCHPEGIQSRGQIRRPDAYSRWRSERARGGVDRRDDACIGIKGPHGAGARLDVVDVARNLYRRVRPRAYRGRPV